MLQMVFFFSFKIETISYIGTLHRTNRDNVDIPNYCYPVMGFMKMKKKSLLIQSI